MDGTGMVRSLILLSMLSLAACGLAPEVDRSEVAEFVVFRSDDDGASDRSFRIRLNGETAGEVRAGEAFRYGVPAGAFTLSAETEPRRLPLDLGLDLAPLERANKNFDMRPGRQVVIQVQTGPLGGPMLIERRRAEVLP